MQFGFRFQILLFTCVRFSTKTLAYLAYKAHKAFKAFMAFKRSRLNPFQNSSSTLIALIYSNCADKIACSGVRHTAITGHSVVFP